MIPKEWLQLHHSCCLCAEKSPRRLCAPCEQDFLETPQYCCTCCGLPLEQQALLCGECLTQLPAFDHTFSPFLYQKPLSDLILQFKESSDVVIGEALAELLSREIQQRYQQQALTFPDYLVTPPMHWRKRWQRAFDHAGILCQRIHKEIKIPIYKHIKKLNNQQADQKALSRKERILAMQNIFEATKPLSGQHVAIVDDVMTTGATANAMALALKQAGAGYVTVWALARTPKPSKP
jgi:ComF family protein